MVEAVATSTLKLQGIGLLASLEPLSVFNVEAVGLEAVSRCRSTSGLKLQGIGLFASLEPLSVFSLEAVRYFEAVGKVVRLQG